MSRETIHLLALGLSQAADRAARRARTIGRPAAAIANRARAVVIYDRVLTKYSYAKTARALDAGGA